MGLNEGQMQIAQHRKGPLLGLAGAGSGKTTSICCMLVELVSSGVDPNSILATTFTRKAAGEMSRRIEHAGIAGLTVGTLHGVSYELLRNFSPKHCNSTIKPRFKAKDALGMLGKPIPDVLEARDIDSFVAWAKASAKLPRHFRKKDLPEFCQDFLRRNRELRDYLDELVKCYRWYEDAREELNVLTFDDILIQAVKMLMTSTKVRKRLQRRYKYVVVDEYQDVNRVQFKLLDILARPQLNLVAVGDDDQAIYGFRGSDHRFILEFQERYSAPIVRLEQNYRSRPAICKAANLVIGNNAQRLGKTLLPTRKKSSPEDSPVIVRGHRDEWSESDWIASLLLGQIREGRQPGDTAILVRTRRQFNPLRSALARAEIPHVIIGGRALYETGDVQALISYLRLAAARAEGRDGEILALIEATINNPKRGCGPAFLRRLRNQTTIDGSHWTGLSLMATGTKKGTIERYQRVVDDVANMIQEGEYRVRSLLDHFVRNILELGGNLKDRDETFGYILEDSDTYDDTSKYLAFVDQQLLDEDNPQEQENRVSITTIHKSKGLEWDVVILAGCGQEFIPSPMSLREDLVGGMEEERRLFYVAVTRARDLKVLSYYGAASQFIRELKD